MPKAEPHHKTRCHRKYNGGYSDDLSSTSTKQKKKKEKWISQNADFTHELDQSAG